MNNKILKELNKVYSKQNPSVYIKNFLKKNRIKNLVENRKKFLLQLKLPQKVFEKSYLLDLGCGSGQNSIVYDFLGAKCTLVEFNRHSFQNTKKLFNVHANNSFKVINKDIFKFKTKKKFDIVVLNGVAHHTFDPKKSIDLACKFLKRSGFIILGVSTHAGWFQRNLQRAILYTVSSTQEEIIKNAKNLFKNHLKRAKKFGLRTNNQVIYDTYVNPTFNCVSHNEVINIFKKNRINIYSSLNSEKNLEEFLNPRFEQQAQSHFKETVKKNLNMNEIQEFSLTNNIFSQKKIFKKIFKVKNLVDKLTKQFNNIIPQKKINYSSKYLNYLINEFKKTKKINLIDSKYNIKFLEEVKIFLNILDLKIDKKKKLIKIKREIYRNKHLFLDQNGVGINYFVGYKK